MRFTPRPVRFGRRPTGDEAEALPAPQRVKLLARRAAGIAEAAATLAHLPGRGESLHAITTSRMNLTDILNALLEKLGRCDEMVIASLGYGPRNLRMLLSWLDSGAVGGLTLLASLFFKAHNSGLFEETLSAFRQRKQKFACGPSHAKVVCMSFASGETLTIEGSANLRASGSVRENLTLIHDAQLTEWHARWIRERVAKYEGADDEKAQAKAEGQAV